jgi:hypothetical protein
MATVPFSDSAAATSDASGSIVFTGFQQPRVGMWRTGSLSVVRSDGTAVVPSSVLPITWKAYVAKTIWGTWYNDQPSNLVQTAGPAVEVRGTNLAASTAYQCIYTGYDSDNPPPLSPLPAPAPPPSGFTTIVSGIANVTAITVNPQYLTATGGLSATPVWFPVSVGTALEIAYMQAVAANLRLTPLWSTTGTGAGTIVHNADTFDLSFVSPNNVMQGMTYLNHGPFVAFLVQGVGSTPGFVINTGLPPIVRGPSVSGGDLTRYNAPIADGADSGQIFLPPYVGDAQLFLTALVAGASPAAGAIFAILRSQDYLGASSELARVGATTQFLAASGTTSLQPGYIWKMSPRINSIQVYNRIGGGTAVSVDMAISASGP